jgi:RNA polymerase sigma-70 factor (ECF subfamily)
VVQSAGETGVSPPSREADAALVERARAGDQAAFEEVVLRHRRMIWSVCLRITVDRFDAEDAVQDALVAAWHHLGTFRGDAAVSTWLYRIAANAATAIVRRRRPEPTDELPTPGAPDFSQSLVDGDLVQRCLAQLPPVFREALVLRELCDLSYDAVAAHQGVGIQTVKSRLHRARGLFRAALEQAIA